MDSNEFEILEFYGDAYLYERVSYFIMTTRRFMDPNLMTKLRCSCIKNANLASVFEQLKLAELLDSSTITANLTLKNKADILEAIIGELAEDSSTGSEDLLSALIAYIAYMGDKEYFQETNAAGASMIGESMTPPMPKKSKQRRRHRARKDSVTTSPNPSMNSSRSLLDPKSAVNHSSPVTYNSQKPLFILGPSSAQTNPNITPVTIGSISNNPSQPSHSKVTRSESLPAARNRSRNNQQHLPFIVTNQTSNPPEPPGGKEVITFNGSRNIFIHKIMEVSTSSESSSGSNSLSSSPKNSIFPLYGHPMLKSSNLIPTDMMRITEIKSI